MTARRGAALTLAILALALGGSACGGAGSAKTTTATAAERAAAVQWRAGLVRWQRSMSTALTGISVVFSTGVELVDLQSHGTRASRSLLHYEHTLATCTSTIRQLGQAPEAFGQARVYALTACGTLERGEKLVEAAVRDVRSKRPSLNPLGAASDVLSTGESEMKSAGVALTIGIPSGT